MVFFSVYHIILLFHMSQSPLSCLKFNRKHPKKGSWVVEKVPAILKFYSNWITVVKTKQKKKISLRDCFIWERREAKWKNSSVPVLSVRRHCVLQVANIKQEAATLRKELAPWLVPALTKTCKPCDKEVGQQLGERFVTVLG